MDARELRIGNLFYPIDRNSVISLPIEIPHVIKEISEIHVKSHRYETPIHKVIKYDEHAIYNVSPIPLTEEILLKCGFARIPNTAEFTNGFMSIFLLKSGNNYEILISQSCVHKSHTEIKYLHQLQNLYFALTGQELEVNL